MLSSTLQRQSRNKPVLRPSNNNNKRSHPRWGRVICVGGQLLVLLYLGLLWLSSAKLFGGKQEKNNTGQRLSQPPINLPGMSSPLGIQDHAQLLQSHARNSSSTTPSRIRTARQPQKDDKRQILLVHVGKTGGETLKHILRIGCTVRTNRKLRAKCEQRFIARYGHEKSSSKADETYDKEPLLSRLVTGYFHYKLIKPPTAVHEATHFLFTIRHPLSRIQSWFRYISPLNCPKQFHKKLNSTKKHKISELPVNCRTRAALKQDAQSPEAKFFACFPTLPTLAEAVPTLLLSSVKDGGSRENHNQQDGSATVTTACRQELQNLLTLTPGQGSESLFGHWIMNYQYYVDRTLVEQPDVPVLVLRTEALWGDLKQLNQYLIDRGPNGGRDTSSNNNNPQSQQQPNDQEEEEAFAHEGLRVTHDSQHYMDQANLNTDQEARHLCCLLHREIQIYTALVRRAVNLHQTEKEETLRQLRAECAFDSWAQFQRECRNYQRALPTLSGRWQRILAGDAGTTLD